MNPYLNNVTKVMGTMQFLPSDEMKIALASPDKNERFVAGYFDYIGQHLLLFRGDGMSLVVPASVFEPRMELAPDFNLFELTDCGAMIKLGLYEVTNEFILKAMDPKFEAKREENEIRIRARAKVSN